ncbi:MAG: RNA-guided endonuclease InsQ/TnpB family protein [Limisphaerales bacterium]
MVIRANAKVVDAYKLDRAVQTKFRPLGSFPYDARLLSWNLAESAVSIWSLAGRLRISFICGKRQLQMLFYDRGEADLLFREGSFYLFVSVSLPETEAPRCENWLGVDLGLVNIAADSEGRTYGEARKVAGIRKRRWRQRKRLQSKCTRSAKRVLKRLRSRETRFIHHQNHTISKQICAEAKRTGCGIALEELKGIRGRIRASKAQRRILHSWAFADLQSKIAYKCRLNGIAIKFVDPTNTSRSCPACGHVAKGNRKTRDRFACVSCGFTADADTNAAGIISRRAAIDRPHERGGVRAHVR